MKTAVYPSKTKLNKSILQGSRTWYLQAWANIKTVSVQRGTDILSIYDSYLDFSASSAPLLVFRLQFSEEK